MASSLGLARGASELLAGMSSGLAVSYVQTARGVVSDGRVMMLTDLAPATIWFLHGTPGRVGHLATGTFLDLWWSPDRGLAASPPPARLGLADPDAQVLGEPVVRLRCPSISGSGLRYEIELLEGVLPERSGACVLLIGPVTATPPVAARRGSVTQ